ncbi:hypothetical protein GGX14DRAFT_405272 [Mycena pura]|uniref:Uncharacterized protein n=1 Tax=Mycena pura TaxID=153505 RepID=A0AAD6Y4F0_9AGAR|nr:hypothetical protein GGX14DRAFT_405272 [Mycena pura]
MHCASKPQVRGPSKRAALDSGRRVVNVSSPPHAPPFYVCCPSSTTTQSGTFSVNLEANFQQDLYIAQNAEPDDPSFDDQLFTDDENDELDANDREYEVVLGEDENYLWKDWITDEVIERKLKIVRRGKDSGRRVVNVSATCCKPWAGGACAAKSAVPQPPDDEQNSDSTHQFTRSTSPPQLTYCSTAVLGPHMHPAHVGNNTGNIVPRGAGDTTIGSSVGFFSAWSNKPVAISRKSSASDRKYAY